MTPAEVLAQGSKSFAFAARFLPADARADAAVVYALCRTIDDEVDTAEDPEAARVGLAALAGELRGERPARPLVQSFQEVAQRRGIDPRHALELIEGVGSDLGSVRMDSEVLLLRYAYRVAGTVGLMMASVVGVRDPAAPPFAVDLGVAMQLTNIARDVREDAAIGRIYLPRPWLEQAGVDPEALLRGEAQPSAVAEVVRRLLAEAERYYQSADRGLSYIPARPRLGILVAARVYRGIGRLLLARGANPLRGRTIVSPARRLWIAAGAVLSYLRPSLLGWRSVPRHDPGLHRAIAHLPGANADGSGSAGYLQAGG